MREPALLKHLQMEATKLGARLFRNVVSCGWTGKAKYFPHKSQVIIDGAHPLHAGLCIGSSDLIGFRPLLITEHHVGKTLCQFIAVEGKTSGTRLTDEQAAFLDAVRDAGGVAVVAYSVDDLKTALTGDASGGEQQR